MGGLACLAGQCLKIKPERVDKLEAWCLWTVAVCTKEVGRWRHGEGRASAKEDVYPWSLSADGASDGKGRGAED